MVIDDNTKIQYAFHLLLKKEGCIIIGSMGGNDAIKKFKKKKPKAVFLDLSLPHSDGLNILQQLRKLNPSVPVIITSSINSDDIDKQAAKLGAFAYLEKPLSVNKIREVLKNLKV